MYEFLEKKGFLLIIIGVKDIFSQRGSIRVKDSFGELPQQ